MIEGADYFVRCIPFANRANKALAVTNDDGTYDIYLNSLYDTEQLREALAHELRHLDRCHFDLDLAIRRIEAQADGESVCIIGHTAPENIPHFFSEAHFAHWVKTLAAQRGADLAKANILGNLQKGSW